MKATTTQQHELLNLAETDLEISRTNRALQAALSGAEREDAQSRLAVAAEKLLTARHAVDEFTSEIERIAQDLQLVEDRIAKDDQRLRESSSPKDIQGIQHELVSLQKRKATLEDVELENIEQRDSANLQVESAASYRAEIQHELDAIDAKLESETIRLRSGLALLEQQRSRHLANLTAEQIELYQRLLGKTLPVARLEGFTCRACNLNLSGASIDSVRNTPSDEIARCPECAAMLVRG